VTEASGPPRQAGDPALTAAKIAALIGGTLHGDGGVPVTGIAPLNRAGPDQLSFLADPRYAALLGATQAGTVLLSPEFADAATAARARIVVANPYDALVALLPRLYPPHRALGGVHPTAIVDSGAKLGMHVSIEPFAVVGEGATLGDRVWIGPHCAVGRGVSIGADSRLVSHVTCYEGAVLGERVLVHAGARIASDGFGYAFGGGEHKKVLHIGRCIIHNDVEIGANSCIDRGSIDDTIVGAGTKIDNLVHVAHNVQIGRLCLLMAQVGVAGSSKVEDGAILAGQSGVAGHLRIGSGARIAAQAGVISDVPAGESWSGYPARPHRDALRASAALHRLAAIIRQVEKLIEGKK